MPSPSAIARQAAMLAALIGCALAVGPARQASASSCHVPERPVFGLTIEPEPAALPAPGPAESGLSEPIRIDPRCPAEEPDRPSSRVDLPGELPIETAESPVLAPSRGLLDRDDAEARPTRRPYRIDRPPRCR